MISQSDNNLLSHGMNINQVIIKRTILLAIKLIREINEIFKYKNLEINASSDNQNLNFTIDGKPYRLDELGSGLAQFIVVLANIAIKKPSWILIDEPELNLHPSLQTAFLSILGSYASEGVIFSSHNLGLARSSADFIYSFHIDDAGKNEVRVFETIPRLSEFLGEMSYAGYKDIGFNKILLVEGPSEIRTIPQFLRKYDKDQKIALLSLGGSSLIKSSSEYELEEIKRIADGRVSALIDSELKSSNAIAPKERQEFYNTCRKIDINCHILARRAIENYFTERAIKIVKRDSYRALNFYEKLEEMSPCWGKQENWQIAKEMNKEEIGSTDLGEFFKNL